MVKSLVKQASYTWNPWISSWGQANHSMRDTDLWQDHGQWLSAIYCNRHYALIICGLDGCASETNQCLTHLPLVPHIKASVNWVSIGSGNGLMPVQHQAIIWTNADLLLIGSLGTNFSEILMKIQNFSFMKMCLKMSSAKLLSILSRGR